MALHEITEWWEDHNNLAATAEYMFEVMGDNVENIIYMLEKPWKFDDDYKAAMEYINEDLKYK